MDKHIDEKIKSILNNNDDNLTIPKKITDTPIKNNKNDHVEEYMIKGANYINYSDNVNAKNINIKILDQDKKENIPNGYNFIFENFH